MTNETNIPSQYDTDYGYDQTYDPAFIAEQQRALGEAAARVQARTTPGDDRHASPPIPLNAYGYDQQSLAGARPEYSDTISTQDQMMNQPVLTTVTTQKPESHIWLSVFTCVCCCMPLGLVATIMSLKANSAAENGSYDVARSYAQMAKGLVIAGVIVGTIIAVIAAVIFFNADSYVEL